MRIIKELSLLFLELVRDLLLAILGLVLFPFQILLAILSEGISIRHYGICLKHSGIIWDKQQSAVIERLTEGSEYRVKKIRGISIFYRSKKQTS
jgi:hypothetical protein